MHELQELLYFHLRKYPGMQPVDCLKLLYQSEMGPGHLLGDRETFATNLAKELQTPGLVTAKPKRPEEIGARFSRMYLSGFDGGPVVDTFTRLCEISAGEPANMEALQQKLHTMRELAAAGGLPFNPGLMADMLNRFVLEGCPNPHHSERYRQLYQPHYRVLRRDLAVYLPVFAAVDRALAQKPHVLVGIDGMSASGKSSLAALLQRVYGAGVVHTDDFFLQPYQRSAQRLDQPGGNIDYERLAPVAAQAADDRPFAYQSYDCGKGELAGFVQVPEGRVTVLEGVYALHPQVGAPCDVQVFLYLDAPVQAARIAARSPALASRFASEWIPMENLYFGTFAVREGADIALDTTTL